MSRLAAPTILAVLSLVVLSATGVAAAPDPPDSAAVGPILELPGLTVVGQRVGGNIIEVDIEDLPPVGPGDDATFRFTGDVRAFAHSMDDGYSYGGLVGVSNEHHRFQAGATRDHGDNLRFGGGGKVAASAYDRGAWEVGYGFRDERYNSPPFSM